jgi:peptidyl-prolyl cis-trans isomerase D
MLSAIRALARSPIFGGFIIALLIAAFALFGVNDIFRGAGTAAVLVGDERVAVQDLARAYERQLQSIQRENPRFTREQADEFGLGEQMVQMLTAQAAVEAKARELGLAVSDQQVLDAIQEIDAFKNPFNNRFDPATYISVLQANGYSGARAGQQFEAELTEELLRTQVLSAILGGVEAPRILATSRRAFEDERRAISALLIPPSLAGDIGEADDETLSQFISENAQIFQQPEQRRFTLVRFSPDDYSRDVDIPEDDLRDLYQFQLDTGELAEPPTRSITQWIVADQAAADAGAAALQAGQSPSDAGLGESVSLEDVQAFEIPDAAISEAAFGLQAGDVTAVEGRLGWRVVRIDAASDPEVPSFEDQRAALVEQLSGSQTLEMMSDALARFEDARAQGLTFEAAGAEANVPVERFDFLTANGATVDGIPAVTLATAPEIVAAVFATPPGFETDADRFGEEGYFMIRVDEIIPERVPEVDEVREFAEAVWRARSIDDQLQALLDDAMARLAAGENLNVISESLPGSIVETAILGRGESSGPFSQQVVQAAFFQDANTPFEARASDPSTRMAAVVTDIIAPSAESFDPAGQIALSQELGNDITVALEAALFASYEVRRDQRLIDLALGRTDPEDLP